MNSGFLRLVPCLVLCLVLAACQPIQPEQSAGAEAVAVPAEAPVAAQADVAAQAPAVEGGLPALSETYFPIPGVTIGLPEGWLYSFEPTSTELDLYSELAPKEPQVSHAFWPYLMEEPIVEVTLVNMPDMEAGGSDLGAMLVERFKFRRNSGDVINPLGSMKVAEEPSLLEINGQKAAKAVVEGKDLALKQPFRAHVWAIQGDDQILFVSSALLEQNEEAFLPLIEAIVATVNVGSPTKVPVALQSAKGEIAPGQVVTDTLAYPKPDEVVRDHWHFAGEAGKRYTFTITPLAPYPPGMVGNVVDADGKSLINGEARSFDHAWFRSPFTVKEDGDYYLVVRSMYGEQTPYTVELEEAE